MAAQWQDIDSSIRLDDLRLLPQLQHLGHVGFTSLRASLKTTHESVGLCRPSPQEVEKKDGFVRRQIRPLAMNCNEMQWNGKTKPLKHVRSSTGCRCRCRCKDGRKPNQEATSKATGTPLGLVRYMRDACWTVGPLQTPSNKR